MIAKGFQALNQLDIRALAKPELRHLTDRYNENSMLMIEQNEQVVIIELCEANVPIKLTMRLGQCHPFYRGAAPKVLLAFQPEERIRSVVERIVFEPLTGNTIREKSVLLERLAQIRRDGHCISEGEIDSQTLAVAVPIMDAQNRIIASMAVSGPQSRVDRQNIKSMIEDLKESAKRISQRLGAQ
ncbi:HTH-type transcriptional regulator KipR [bioreactor metagenome]|uniref:HTH-type transcriptional regulator KipR n=1 Tax=bioreactor metagenome TaxID=1076179 RepID=A0A645H259_9ZZZZ